MNYQETIAALARGRTVVVKPHGNSMTPLIRSGQPVELTPITEREPRVGDAVLAKVKGHYYIHKVTAIGHDGRYQIANNHGHVNGWTYRVFGVVTNVG